MPFLLLLLLALVALQREWPEPPDWVGAAGSAALTWGGVALLVLAAALCSRRLCRQLVADLSRRPALLRRYTIARRRHTLALMAFYLIALCLLGWGWTARALLTHQSETGELGRAALSGAPLAHALPARESLTLPGVELIMLAPFLAGLLLSWACFYDAERAAQDTAPLEEGLPFPTRWAYVALQARHNLLLVAPPLLLMLVQQGILTLFPALQHDHILLPLFAVILLAAVFLSIPLVLRLLLGLRPLPPGPLRDRLLATARRLSFRFTDVLIWDTRNTVANAMVTGPVRWLRYVVLTDRLVKEMSHDEIEAVFGHEVGHIKHHHMLFYFAFLMASLLLIVAAWTAVGALVARQPVQQFLREQLPALTAWIDSYKVLTAVPLLGLLGGYTFLVFGFLSRRCERQADVFGCRTVSVEVFIDALEKVAVLNGISRERPGWLSSWQHSTIARRVAFLRRLLVDPALEPRFQRKVRLIKWGMVLSVWGLALTLGAVLMLVEPELFRAILSQM